MLHVDSDPEARETVDRFLGLELGEVETVGASDPASALERVEEQGVDCVVSEFRAAGFDGIEFLEAVRERDPQVPFLFFSDTEDDLAAVQALDAGADGFLRKREDTERYVRLAQRLQREVESSRRRDSLARTVRDFSRLFNHTDDVFWMYTADWSEVVFVNAAYEDVWGQPLSVLESDPRAFLDAVHPEDRGKVTDAMADLSDGSPVELEFRVDPTADFETWVWVRGSPIVDDGAVEYVAGYVRDVTDRRRRERELERRTDQLERQAEQREFFNSVLRHDVLNGMNVIRGRSEHLVDELDTPAHREQAETIHKWAEEITEIIDHIRAVLQTISDEGGQSLEPVAVGPVVEAEVERVASAYPETDFEIDVPEDCWVRADELLSTVVNNLLTNAVEHNDPEGLRVRVSARETGETVRLRVADTGDGIPDDRKDAVFERGESTRSGTERGGLGLFMVDSLVTTYGGEVRIEDTVEGGTAVVLELPAADPD